MLHKALDSLVPRSFKHDEIATESSAHPQIRPDGLDLPRTAETIVVRGGFPSDDEIWQHNDFVEIVRDPNEPSRLAFLRWNNGTPAILHEIDRDGKRYVPPPKGAGLLAKIVLPDRISPSGSTRELASDLESVISRFVEIDPDDVQKSVSFVLSSWFPECFETVPYLWLLGLFGGAKTTLLKVLRCLCRRSVLVGDIRAAGLYRLAHETDITLLIDEVELDGSRSSSEMARFCCVRVTRGARTRSETGSASPHSASRYWPRASRLLMVPCPAVRCSYPCAPRRSRCRCWTRVHSSRSSRNSSLGCSHFASRISHR